MWCLEGVNKNRGNKVIVTTRIEDVALKVETLPNQRHQPGKLKDEECWSIIKEKACGDSPISPSLVLIGEEIAKQCHGMPLAAKVIGGTMRKIERSRGAWLKIQKSDVWDSVYSVLRLSFDHLSSPCLKKCFAYCAMFPKDFCFRKEQLIQLWMAEGFLGASKEMMDTLGWIYMIHRLIISEVNIWIENHATSPKCFSYLSEASRIVNKVSRDIRPEFSSVPESHSCFAPNGSTYNCHPVMELTLATNSPAKCLPVEKWCYLRS
ncbi:hypothetical protein GOBAR_AA24507 [Gossypium barbadense]|uniref:Uncharacterized protein n=1 Tax=Gossypium barbadense TaxID=3634 RepID=A0A2P5WYJ7_GOSBA|nr:hypothetical protein GOBAR_AA24507 [Gossypium barbadense]